MGMITSVENVVIYDRLLDSFEDDDQTVFLNYPYFFGTDGLANVPDLFGEYLDETAEDEQKRLAIHAWLDEQVGTANWGLSYNYLGFVNEADAFAFKMRWL